MLGKRRIRVRLHLEGTTASVEGLLVRWPRGVNGHYVLVDAAVLESRVDRHDLESAATHVPRDRVLFFEEVRG